MALIALIEPARSSPRIAALWLATVLSSGLVGCGTLAEFRDAKAAGAPGGRLDREQEAEEVKQREIAAGNQRLAQQEQALQRQIAVNESLLRSAQSSLESASAAASAALKSARLSASQRAELTSQLSAVQADLARLKLQKGPAQAAATDPAKEAARKVQYEQMKARADAAQKRVNALVQAASKG